MTLASPSPAVAVCIGRFQPLHRAHLALLQEALARAPRCVVVLGSAHQARTPKNPWSWRERAEMIRLALPPQDRERLHFLPLRDHYDEARWAAALRTGVAAALAGWGLPPDAKVALVGHLKDPTSNYLHGFPGWEPLLLPRLPGADASQVRDALFSAAAGHPDAALAALVDELPPSTVGFLRAWLALPWFAALAPEWRMLKGYREAWAAAPYPPVFVTVDAVVRCAGHVLLVRRGHAPGKGLLAAPGGFIEQRETTWQSAVRELREETGLELSDAELRRCLKARTVFDHPERSQRGRTITHAHHFDLGERALPAVQGGDDAAEALWVPLADLPALEDRFLDDHFHMLDHFLGLTGDAG